MPDNRMTAMLKLYNDKKATTIEERRTIAMKIVDLYISKNNIDTKITITYKQDGIIKEVNLEECFALYSKSVDKNLRLRDDLVESEHRLNKLKHENIWLRAVILTSLTIIGVLSIIKIII